MVPFAARCQGPVSRRQFLRFGALGFGSLSLADVLRLRSQASSTNQAAPDTSVIFIWLPGGAPHMETYDLKPDAPSEYRGELRPIATNVPGCDVGELLPLHAKIADRYTIVRSVAHNFADHGGGHKRFMTARDPKEPVGFVNDFPAVPSMIAKLRERTAQGLPHYVAGTDAGRQGIDVFSFGSAYLGQETHPFIVAGDPSRPDFKIENLVARLELQGRLDDRMALLRNLDGIRRDIDQTGLMDSMDEFHRRAVEMISSDKAARAFDLSREPDAVRDRYGRHAYGCRALMARRLVEAGCSFVTMVMENPTPGQPLPSGTTYNWDSHAVNCHMYVDARFRFPYYDQAVTALVEDLYQRGLDRKVLLVVTGEFGRTPRVNTQVGSQTGVAQPGRDHWPGANSLLVAGGGMRTGQVVGATNTKGEYPTQRPLTPNDLWATMLKHLGINPEHAFLDHAGRPMPILPYGEPIRELLPVS